MKNKENGKNETKPKSLEKYFLQQFKQKTCFCVTVALKKKWALFGREPWSSGYGRRLVFQRV